MGVALGRISDSMETPAIQAEWEGNTIRILDPRFITRVQTGTGRNGVAGEKARCGASEDFTAPVSVRFWVPQVDLGHLRARDWLKVAKQVLKLTTGNRARKIAGKHQIIGRKFFRLLPLPKASTRRSEAFGNSSWSKATGNQKAD